MAFSLDWFFEFGIIVTALFDSEKVHLPLSFYSLYHKTSCWRLNEPWVTVEESFECAGAEKFLSLFRFVLIVSVVF